VGLVTAGFIFAGAAGGLRVPKKLTKRQTGWALFLGAAGSRAGMKSGYFFIRSFRTAVLFEVSKGEVGLIGDIGIISGL
jgi:hypothetical protein